MTEGRQIIFIVGAGRSGTNLISDILSADPRFFNLHENRYVWNFGQRDLSTDFRPPSAASDRVVRYLHKHFDGRAADRNVDFLIDKTPGNALRLPFVKTVFPNGKVINIIRDGRANVASRIMLWDDRDAGSRNPKLAMARRFLEHVRYMRRHGCLPTERLPVFVRDNALEFLGAMFANRKHLAGERVSGLRHITATEGLRVARAVQWRETVMRSVVDGRKLGPDHYHELRLEDLARQPQKSCRKLFAFLGLTPPAASTEFIAGELELDRIDRWKRHLTPAMQSELEPIIRPTMEFLGYDY